MSYVFGWFELLSKAAIAQSISGQSDLVRIYKMFVDIATCTLSIPITVVSNLRWRSMRIPRQFTNQ
jgi:hypothetical protein